MLLLSATAGCSEVQKFSWDRLKETHYKMVTGKTFNKSAKPIAGNEGQADPVEFLAGPEKQDSTAAVADTETTAQSSSKVSVALYFTDAGGDCLKVEKREIPLVTGLARATVLELIAGPRQKGLVKTVPEGTKLLDINIQDSLCTVNLSKEFRDNHWGGSSGEMLTVYSIVNTLTQFPTVEKVELLVEGQKIDSLAGHMDLSVPVSRNSQIIKSEK